MGVLFSALRNGRLTLEKIEEAVQCATMLTVSVTISRFPVHSVTDITRFGLLGHALEVAKASDVTFCINIDAIPIMRPSIEIYQEGFSTSITEQNIAFIQDSLRRPPGLPLTILRVSLDPQTNGGLLIALPEEHALETVEALRSFGFNRSTIIGVASRQEKEHLVLL